MKLRTHPRPVDTLCQIHQSRATRHRTKPKKPRPDSVSCDPATTTRANVASPRVQDIRTLYDAMDLSYITRQLPWRPDITVINFNRLQPHLDDLWRFQWQGTVIIDSCLDPWCIPQKLDQIWHGRDYWVLTNESQESRPRHVYVPLWFWQYSQRWWDQPRPDITAQRSWSVSCLNRFPRIHRYYTVRGIMQRAWRHRALLSLGRIDWDPYNRQEILPGHRITVHMGLSDLREWCEQQPLPLQDWPEPPDRDTNDHTLQHPAYWDTACNVITETSIDSSGFITEKTAKALAAGQLWCMVSGSDTVHQLQHLGFDVMRDVWQHHRYLQHAQWHHRINAMLPVLDTVVSNMADVWHQTQGARQHNQQWLFGDEMNRRILAPLRDRDLLARP